MASSRSPSSERRPDQSSVERLLLQKAIYFKRNGLSVQAKPLMPLGDGFLRVDLELLVAGVRLDFNPIGF